MPTTTTKGNHSGDTQKNGDNIIKCFKSHEKGSTNALREAFIWMFEEEGGGV